MTVINQLAFFTDTVGTGSITSVGTATALTQDISAVPNGTNLNYGIIDGNNWEYGTGLCNGTTLVRGTIASSSSGTGAIVLSGNNALVFSTAAGGASQPFGSSGCAVYSGSGPPSFAAAKGSLYTNITATTTTTRLYINTNGGTGWASFTSSA